MSDLEKSDFNLFKRDQGDKISILNFYNIKAKDMLCMSVRGYTEAN